MAKPKLIFDFNTAANIFSWYVVDDGVMGGSSKSTFSLNKEGHAVFKGTVSLENNGGFCSARSRFKQIKVGEYTKICLTLKGDGKKYQCRIKDKASNEYSYVLDFSTSKEWEEITIPLQEMYPTFRGRKLNLPNFSEKGIEEVIFLIGNKKAEDFQLLINKIELK